jgi:hypothetical protein
MTQPLDSLAWNAENLLFESSSARMAPAVEPQIFAASADED